MYESWSLADVQFQTWLSITFAAVVTIYFGQGALSKFYRLLIVLLYSVTSVILIGAWLTHAAHGGVYTELLAQQFDFRFPVPHPWIAPTRLGLMIVASLATTIFVVIYKKDESS